MAKAYWVSCYHSISDPAARAECAELAGPALAPPAVATLLSGRPAKVYEAGIDLPVVVVEFDSVAQAIAAHESAKAALAVLGNTAVVRDMRIVEGVDD